MCATALNKVRLACTVKCMKQVHGNIVSAKAQADIALSIIRHRKLQSLTTWTCIEQRLAWISKKKLLVTSLEGHAQGGRTTSRLT